MPTYLLLDAARMAAHLHQALQACQSSASLLQDTPDAYLAEVGPYLLEAGPESASWFIQYGWGNAWGMLLSSPAAFPVLTRHLKQFITVQSPSGQKMFFRFYDPRVLPAFFATSNTAQLLQLFGPVQDFIMESDEGPAMRYSLRNQALYAEAVDLQLVLKPPQTTQPHLPVAEKDRPAAGDWHAFDL